MKRFKHIIILAVVGATAISADAQLLRRDADSSTSRRPGQSREELNARSIIDNAVEAFSVGQDERGVKALEQVGKQYPNTNARFTAYLLLGEHHMEKRSYQEAIPHLSKVVDSEDDDQVSRALAAVGICHYEMNAFDKAVSSLRQVINRYPGSAATNDAYYYIGLCHYHRKRWGKALEAFEMVGTSVADREDDGEALAEAGRRLFVRVRDRDLSVLEKLGNDISVKVKSSSGDEENVPLEAVGRSDSDYVASIRSATDASQPGDGILHIRGGDTVTVTYTDVNTEAGAAAVKRQASVRLVSTAGLAITDGAFRQSAAAVAVGQPIYIRLKDLDLDTSTQTDDVRLELLSRYAVVKEETLPGEGEAAGGVDLTADRERIEWIERSTGFITLRETEASSGLFVGSFTPFAIEDDATTAPPAGRVAVRPGDEVVVRYIDKLHLRNEDPMPLVATTMIVETGSPELENMVSVSSDRLVQARKLLLEAELRQMLAEIFKEMGLNDRAADKAEAGLERVDEILAMHGANPFSREIVEEAFAAKWNLYLAAGDVNSAIKTCKALLDLHPDSTLVDQAFLTIGRAYYESDNLVDLAKAPAVLKLVIDMENASGRAEASYLLGQVFEKQASLGGQQVNKSLVARSVAQYMVTAEQFPDSAYAADALKNVIKYYYENGDYRRTAELLERVCRDYRDQDWLHKMVLTWGVVHLRMSNRELGIEKLRQVIEEYPESDSAVTANDLLKKLTGGSTE